MAVTKQTECKYKTKEEEEVARKKMEEEARKRAVESEESQAGKSQEAGMAEEGQTTKEEDQKGKDKKPKTGVKRMMKEERQRKSEELKAQRKERALEKKRAKEEAAREKAKLKREEHRMLLEKTQALLRRNPPAATTSRADNEPAAAADVEVHPTPTRAEQPEDPLETSLVESGPPLVSLDPFEGEDEPVIRPPLGAHPGAAAILIETIHEESIGEPSQEVHQGRQWEKLHKNKQPLRRTGRHQALEP